MKKRAFCLVAFLFGAVVFLQNPLFLYTQSSILILIPKVATPSEEIRATIEYAQSVLSDPSLPEAAKKERVKKAAYDRFDFPEMSKRVLARHWAKLTPAEQKEFVALFTELLERITLRESRLSKMPNSPIAARMSTKTLPPYARKRPPQREKCSNSSTASASRKASGRYMT